MNMLGVIYCNTNKIRIKSIISFFLLLIILFYFCIFVLYSKSIVNTSYTIKKSLLKMDKITIVYSLFGESAILPFSIFYNTNTQCSRIIIAQDMYIGKEPMDYFNDINHHYFMNNYTEYSSYFENQYKQNSLGFYIVEDEIANLEYRKRLDLLSNIFNDTKILDTDYPSLLFTPLRKYRNFEITLNDLIKVENSGKENIDKYIILKAKAYIYYKHKDYSKAIELYKEYLNKYPDDYTSLIILGKIYIDEEKYDDAEKIYEHLNSIDKNNMYFLLQLLYISCIENNKNKTNQLIQNIEDIDSSYLSRAIEYKESIEKGRKNYVE